MKERAIELTVNGITLNLTVPVHQTLLDTLREQLGFTDTKYGCGTGECGACTVIIDGEDSLCSCMALASTMNGRSITTAAGLSLNGLNAVQQAFIDKAAVQCGYCTPGMVVKSTSLLRKNPNPTEEEIRKELEGNICRCTGYDSIVKAVQQAAKSFPETDAKWDNAVEVKAGVNA